jgi:hypothetical protein
MTEQDQGQRWIAEQFAAALGLTPENLDWEKHNVGALLQVPVGSEEFHYVKFNDEQIAGAAGSDMQKHLSAWIADHVKQAKRSPSPRKAPYECKLKI